MVAMPLPMARMSACMCGGARSGRLARAWRLPGRLPALVAGHAVSRIAPPRRRDELPEDAEEHPDAAAIKAILDDTSPEEAAEGFKVPALYGWLARAALGVLDRCHAARHRHRAATPLSLPLPPPPPPPPAPHACPAFSVLPTCCHLFAPDEQNQGNDALKTGLRNRKKFYLRQAIEQYGKGLELQCADAGLNSVLCSNRAHVNLLLGNFRNAYQDGLAALRHNDQNVKVRGRWACRPRRCRRPRCCRRCGQQPQLQRCTSAAVVTASVLPRPLLLFTRRPTTAPPRARWACASTTAAPSCARRA